MEADPQDRIELPRNVESVLGMLVLNLTNASRDTGQAYYLDIYPVDPDQPDIYAVDASVRTPND